MSDSILDLVMPPTTRRKLRDSTYGLANVLPVEHDGSDSVSTVKIEKEFICAPFSELQLQDRTNSNSDVILPKKPKLDSKQMKPEEIENVSPGSNVSEKLNMPGDNSVLVKKEDKSLLEGTVSIETAKPKVEEKLSFFEMQRRKNLEENMKFLTELELDSSASVLAPPVVKPKPKTIKSVTKKVMYTEEVLPRRSSARLINARLRESFVEPDYKFEALPVTYEDPVTVKRTRVVTSRPFSGQLQSVDDVTTDENLKACFKEVIASSEAKDATTNHSSKDEVLERLGKLSIADSDIAKCCSGRIYDAKFHPSRDKILIASADKFGGLGFWDVNKESNGLFLTQPHSQPVRHIDFCPSDSTKLYTCSYDGTLKCIDLVASEFTTVCKNPDPRSFTEYNEIHWFDFLNDKQTICAGEQLGKIFIIDPRCSGSELKSVMHHILNYTFLYRHTNMTKY